MALVTEMAKNPMTPEEALTLVGLGERVDHYPSQLSGGEQQRVAIARAVAKRPDVLLCDEPTGALDYPTGKLVLEVIARINSTLGTTAVMITHNAPIAKIADRVMRLADGNIARKRIIETSRRGAREALVDKGLAAGGRVIVYPGDAVREGRRIALRDEKAK